MRPLGQETITIVKPTVTVDTVDNTTYLDWDNVTTVDVKKCSFQPFLPSDKLQFEETRDRDYARSTWRIYAPYVDSVLALKPHDRIRHLGLEYEVYGHIGTWRDMRGNPHHVQIIVQQREG